MPLEPDHDNLWIYRHPNFDFPACPPLIRGGGHHRDFALRLESITVPAGDITADEPHQPRKTAGFLADIKAGNLNVPAVLAVAVPGGERGDLWAISGAARIAAYGKADVPVPVVAVNYDDFANWLTAHGCPSINDFFAAEYGPRMPMHNMGMGKLHDLYA